MKVVSVLVVMLFLLPRGDQAASTIDPAHRFAWSANLGWSDWFADGADGVVIGQSYCSGSVYAANVGWISLGNGAPLNGTKYQNNSPSDFGVNLDETGNLRGYAYGANIGWLNFEDQGSPKVDRLSGKLSGAVWSANCGWISLGDSSAYLQTDPAASGPGDSSTPTFGDLKGASAIRVTPSGVELEVLAKPGATLQLQESADLVTWTPVQSLQSASGTFLFQLSEPAGQARFFRAVQP